MIENFDTYKDKVNRKGKLTLEEAHQVAMLRMNKYKIEDKHNIKGTKEIANLVGYSYRHLAGMFSGRVKIPKRLISTLCFIAGITMEDLEKQYVRRDLDEYINGSGQLIVDGINYGKIIDNE